MVSSKSHHRQLFSVKLTQNTLSAPGWNKKEIKKRISQEAIVTVGASRLVSQTKIACGDFLKRPQ